MRTISIALAACAALAIIAGCGGTTTVVYEDRPAPQTAPPPQQEEVVAVDEPTNEEEVVVREQPPPRRNEWEPAPRPGYFLGARPLVLARRLGLAARLLGAPPSRPGVDRGAMGLLGRPLAFPWRPLALIRAGARPR